VKLSDFGISKELDNSIAMSNTSVGSYRYMSPERLKGEKYDAAGDVWSVGITIIELWEKRYPFLHVADTPISLLGELERVSFSRLLSRSAVGYSVQMKDFILATLEADPQRRPGAADLMGSPWFEITGTNNLVDAQAVRRNIPNTNKTDTFTLRFFHVLIICYVLFSSLCRWWPTGSILWRARCPRQQD